jgi:hypothetical protein
MGVRLLLGLDGQTVFIEHPKVCEVPPQEGSDYQYGF